MKKAKENLEILNKLIHQKFCIKENITVSKIDIKIGAKTISLSLDELKELREVLNNLFPESVRFVPTYPVTIPYFFYPSEPYKWGGWETICQGDSNEITLYINKLNE